MTTRAHILSACGGFTMVEVLVALLLSLGAVATALWFNRAQSFALMDQATQLDIQTTSRAVVDLFSREARRAGMDPRCTKAFNAVADGSTTEVRFQSDLNTNGVLDAATEDLTYRMVENTRIERVGGTVAETLLDGVSLTGSRLRYFDTSGVELVPSPSLTAAQRAVVRRIRLELAVSGKPANPQRTQPLLARAATDVELRNRFFVASTACP